MTVSALMPGCCPTAAYLANESDEACFAVYGRQTGAFGDSMVRQDETQVSWSRIAVTNATGDEFSQESALPERNTGVDDAGDILAVDRHLANRHLVLLGELGQPAENL